MQGIQSVNISTAFGVSDRSSLKPLWHYSDSPIDKTDKRRDGRMKKKKAERGNKNSYIRLES